MLKRGALIVFEGCDRSGKSTQCQQVLKWFQQNNHKVQSVRFPDRTTVIGGLINKYLECNTELDDHVIHLLFSANRWELLPKMRNLLTDGTNLLVDRYAYSGVAFSAAKPDMQLNWCKHPDSGLMKPDVVIFLDIDPSVAKQRGEYGAERYENLVMQNAVRSNYLKLKDETWKVVDANRTFEEVHADICNIIQETLNKITNQTPIESLWI